MDIDALRQEIRDKCGTALLDAYLEDRLSQPLLDAVNAGRVRLKQAPTRYGKGTVLAVLGIEAGNLFLDVIDSDPTFRHVKDIMADGVLDMSLAISQAMVDALVPSVLTADQAGAIKALGFEPDPIAEHDLMLALYGEGGKAWQL